jgi:hypothetical protein
MDATVDYEALDAFYRAEEGGEMVLYRRNNQQRVEFFNSSVSRRRVEGAAPILNGERGMQGSSCFPRGGVTEGCSGAVEIGSRSRALSGLNRGGTQPFRPVRLKACLDRILL